MIELYHIHKKGFYDEQWKVGNFIEFSDKQNNSFINYSYDFKSKINQLDGVQDVPFSDAYNYAKEQNNLILKLELLDIANSIINEQQMFIRELGYEEVRKKFFSELPSRLNCIWLCRKDQIQYWKKFLYGDIEVFKVSLNGRPFKTRNSFISLPSDNYNTILEKAYNYWNYNDDKENEDDEYLFIGKLNILEKI